MPTRLRSPQALSRVAISLVIPALWAVLSCGEVPAEAPARAQLVSIIEQISASGTPTLRAEAIRLAAELGASELEGLIEAGARDESPLVRAASLQAQLQRGNREAIDEALLERLANGTIDARRTALDLVLRYGDPELQSVVIERSLRHSNAEFRSYAFRRVVNDRDTRLSVARETLARALDGDDPVVASEVIERLLQSGVAGPLHRVHERLISEEPSERLAALRVLSNTRSLDAWAHLRWLHQHGTERERPLAALALARLGQGDTADEVIQIIQTADESLTHLALRALAGLPGDRTLAQLRSHREDTRAEVRAAALHSTIVRNRPPEDILPFVEDLDPGVADTAALELLRADLGALRAAVCPDLLLRQDPLPLLRLLWRLWTDRGSVALARECSDQLESLLGAELDDVRALAARLRYQVTGPAMAEARHRMDDDATLYALLDASLGAGPATFRLLYLDLLDHSLASVRLIAAVGLLASTPL